MATQATAGVRGGTLGDAKTWALIGLALVLVGGIVGTIFEQGSDGAAFFYSLAGIGGLIAAPLIAIRHLGAGLTLSAAGFAGLAIVLTSEAVAGFTGEGPDQVLVTMSILHLPPLLLIAAQDWSMIWARAAATVSGVLFAIWGYLYTLGNDPVDNDNPVLIVAWVTFLIATIGWVMALSKEN